MEDYRLKTKIGSHDVCVSFEFSNRGYFYPMIMVTTNEMEGYTSLLVDMTIGDGVYQKEKKTVLYFKVTKLVVAV